MRKTLLTSTIFGLCLVLTGCATTGTHAQDGAVVGTLLGAGLGAIVGNQSDHSGEGALIGAVAGGITGAAIGNAHPKNPHYQAAPAQPNTAPAAQPAPVAAQPANGHYELRLVRTASGEQYEQRVWVPTR